MNRPPRQKPKIVVIVGPTASGKSALAVRLAKKYNGEIISADSRQIYRGLDIGSGKVPGRWKTLFPPTIRLIRSYENDSKTDRLPPKQKASKIFVYKNIPHHCIDFVSPRRAYTAARFAARARRAIDAIARRGHVPIIAGGTAFWIDALVYDFSLPEVAPDARLRRASEKKSPAQLVAILKKLDPRRAREIEQKNPRRLIRAIEIAKTIGRVPKLKKHSPYTALWLGLKSSYEVQPRKIRARVLGMIRRGLVAEMRRQLGAGVSQKRIRELGFEYRAALDFVERRIRRDQLPGRIVKDTLAYAKRQMRWWKRNPEINWVRNPTEALRITRKFLQTPLLPAEK